MTTPAGRAGAERANGRAITCTPGRRIGSSSSLRALPIKLPCAPDPAACSPGLPLLHLLALATRCNLPAAQSWMRRCSTVLGALSQAARAERQPRPEAACRALRPCRPLTVLRLCASCAKTPFVLVFSS